MKAFVDTNILLDVLAKRLPFYQDSVRIWSLAERGKIQAHVSVISFNNIYYVVRRAADRSAADNALHLMRNVFTPRAIDVAVAEPSHRFGIRRFRRCDPIPFRCVRRRRLPYHPRWRPFPQGGSSSAFPDAVPCPEQNQGVTPCESCGLHGRHRPAKSARIRENPRPAGSASCMLLS